MSENNFLRRNTRKTYKRNKSLSHTVEEMKRIRKQILWLMMWDDEGTSRR